MSNKISMSLMVLFFLNLGDSLGTEYPSFPSYLEWRNSSITPTLPYGDTVEEEIDHMINEHTIKLDSLNREWKYYDNLWGAIDRVKDAENGNFCKSLDVGILCDIHEKVLREIIYSTEEIRKLNEIKSSFPEKNFKGK